MSNIVKQIINEEFRTSFKVPDKNLLRWFPGHMNRGLKQMQQKLKLVDCIIEVHDARIPFSGRNPLFTQSIIGIKPHILIFNKKDLIPPPTIKKMEEKFNNEGIKNVIFTNCKNSKCQGVKKIMPRIKKEVENMNRYNRSEEKDKSIMIIGVPNVGKSSLINVLRNVYLKKASAAPTGAVAGVTRSLQNKIKVSENPLIYLFDTPGILTPSIPDINAGFKLAICACLQDSAVGEEIIADYLLYILNKNRYFEYVNVMKLEKPTDDIRILLAKIALNNNISLKIRTDEGYVFKPDMLSAAKLFLRHFRKGDFGKIFLDEDKLNL